MVNVRKKTFSVSKATKPGEVKDWIPFFCEKCGRKLRAAASDYGKIKPCPACKEKISYPDPSFGVGQLIADYMIDGWIEAGSMGEVYMAHNVETGQKVALKLLNSQIDNDGAKLFQQECDILSYFKHDNIVAQNGSGDFHGCKYLAMEYVVGECLDKIMEREEILDEDMVLSIIRQIADALDYVWSKFGIRHRDLKPSNIMMDSAGKIILIDWGMAKQKFYNADNEVLGSPIFMDPVNITQNTGLDCRSDIYSMGVTAFHLLTGDYPFFDEDVDSLIDKVLEEKAPMVNSFNNNISEPTAQLVSYMMAKTYDTRYQNWGEVLKGVSEVMRLRRAY